MGPLRQLPRPLQALTQENLAEFLFEMTDYIGVHEVEFDQGGVIVDARLIWWNNAYEMIRTKKVEFGQSMVDSYYEPQSALFHVEEAWNSGESHQFFRLSPAMRDRYRVLGATVVNYVKWARIGNHVVEVGTDVKEIIELRERLMDQSSLITKSIRQRDLAIERERIACNLHDHVIQNLYAISLVLARAGREADDAVGVAIDKSVSAIEEVIAGIRSEILDLDGLQPSQLRTALTDCLTSILSISGCGLDLDVTDEVIDAEVKTHLCAVCGEAASNAVRHGKASNIRIGVERVGGDLKATISDDGVGIDPDAPLHNGLNNMRQRANSLGGTMQVTDREGGGTVITWTVPNPGWS